MRPATSYSTLYIFVSLFKLYRVTWRVRWSVRPWKLDALERELRSADPAREKAAQRSLVREVGF
jgi:hypothetical protein